MQSPKKRKLDHSINDSKSHIWNSFIEYVISSRYLSYIQSRSSGHYQRFFFDFRFSGRKSQSQQKLSTKITYFTIQFRSKNLTHLCTSTHVKLKIICSRNAAKILSHFTTDFSANMFLFGVRKKHLHCAISSHPKTAFLKHFESKCLYISVYSCISNYQNFCSKDVVRFYLVVWGWWEAE